MDLLQLYYTYKSESGSVFVCFDCVFVPTDEDQHLHLHNRHQIHHAFSFPFFSHNANNSWPYQ